MTTRTQAPINAPPPAPEGSDIGEEESIIEMEIRRR